MSELSTLAHWWADTRASQKGQAPDPGLAYLHSHCKHLANIHRIEPFYGEIDPTVAVVINSLLMEADPLTRHTLTDGIKKAIEVYRATESLARLNDLAVFAPLTMYASFNSPDKFINGLSRYQRFSRTFDWLEASPEHLTEAFAVIKLTACLDSVDALIHNGSHGEQPDPGEEPYLALRDEELANFIATHHEQVNKAIDIVRSRPRISVQLLKEMLEFDQQALLDGVL